jgi:glycosyltransferase involved in cell wall biosynthesis
MNLLLLTYQGDIAGSTFSISYLAKSLAARGHQVYLGCRRESLLYKLLQDSPVHLVPMEFRGKLDRRNMQHIRDLVSAHKIDIINAQSSKDRYTSIFARWFYKLPVKIVHTRRQKPASIGGWLQNTFYVKGTDKIVVISDELKNTFVKMGIPDWHLKVIYNGLPRERFEIHDPAKTEALRKKYGLLPTDRVIGCVGRRKKQEQLLEALKFLPDDLKVMFVGIDKESLEPFISKESYRQQIICTGSMHPNEVMDYYPLFNMNVLCSTTDGFGLVLAEAMGMGVPVIGTNSQGIKNVIEDEVSGLLYTDEDSQMLVRQIQRILQDKTLREKLIENGLERAHKTFSMDTTARNYEAFFLELLKEKSYTDRLKA